VQEVNWVALAVFVALFGFITWLGFAAARWRKGDLDQLHEWVSGAALRYRGYLVPGRRRSLYRLYVHRGPGTRFRRRRGRVLRGAVHHRDLSVPVPGLPASLARLSQEGLYHGGDFVRGRFGNRWLALAITITGIVATMPYIALQLVGIQVVVGALGISGTALRPICR